MSIYNIKELKEEGMNYIRKVVQESGDEHEISCTATYVTDFINYLEKKEEENGDEA